MAVYNSVSLTIFIDKKMESALTKEEEKGIQKILRYMRRLLIGKELAKTSNPNHEMASFIAQAWTEEFKRLTPAPQPVKVKSRPNLEPDIYATVEYRDSKVRCPMGDVLTALHHGQRFRAL